MNGLTFSILNAGQILLMNDHFNGKLHKVDVLKPFRISKKDLLIMNPQFSAYAYETLLKSFLSADCFSSTLLVGLKEEEEEKEGLLSNLWKKWKN